MAINPEHIQLYEEAFEYLRNVLPVDATAMIIGYQEILPDCHPRFPFLTVKSLFESWGWYAETNDLHDSRADFHIDLNGLAFLGRNDLVFDIGTLEHIADSQRGLENYIRALKLGGRLFLLTPCKGYFDHGLHTFSPEYIVETLRTNGCQIERKWYVLPEWKGGWIQKEIADGDQDALLVLIAKLEKPFERPIKAIQQQRWVTARQ